MKITISGVIFEYCTIKYNIKKPQKESMEILKNTTFLQFTSLCGSSNF